MTAGKPLDAGRSPLVAQDRQDCDQEHPPLRETNATAHAAIGQRLEKTAQVASGGRLRRE
jgi:hypothetical protein